MERGSTKTVPSKYIGSIQKQPKGSKPREEERKKTLHLPLLRA